MNGPVLRGGVIKYLVLRRVEQGGELLLETPDDLIVGAQRAPETAVTLLSVVLVFDTPRIDGDNVKKVVDEVSCLVRDFEGLEQWLTVLEKLLDTVFVVRKGAFAWPRSAVAAEVVVRDAERAKISSGNKGLERAVDGGLRVQGPSIGEGTLRKRDMTEMRFHASNLAQEAIQCVGREESESVRPIENRRGICVNLLADPQ